MTKMNADKEALASDAENAAQPAQDGFPLEANVASSGNAILDTKLRADQDNKNQETETTRPDIDYHPPAEPDEEDFYAPVSRLHVEPPGGFLAMGFTEHGNVVYSKRRQHVYLIKNDATFNHSLLATVCDPLWLEYKCRTWFPVKDQQGQIIDWKAGPLVLSKAGNAILLSCQRKGKYIAEDMRGAGVWQAPENPDTLIVNSSELWRTDGTAQERVGAGFIYPLSVDLGIKPGSPKATKDEAKEIYDAITTWTFTAKCDSLLLFGWLMAGYLAGAWNWRVHKCVTSARGGGKSTLVNFEELLLGGAAIKRDSATSRHALMQDLGSRACVVLFDESESNGEGSKVEGHVTLARGASQGDTKIVKGSPQQVTTAATPRFSMGIFGINPPLLEAADVTRFVRFKLGQLKKGQRRPQLLDNPRRIKALGRKLYMRMVSDWPTVRLAYRMIHDTLLDAGDEPRFADTYSSIIASAYIVLHPNREMTQEVANEWLRLYDLSEARASFAIVDDSVDFLQMLLTRRITVGPESMMISEVMLKSLKMQKSATNPYRDELARWGMRAGFNSKSDADCRIHLSVAPTHAGFRDLLEKASYKKTDLRPVLERIEGCQLKVRFKLPGHGQTVFHGVIVPTELETTRNAQKPEEEKFDEWIATLKSETAE